MTKLNLGKTILAIFVLCAATTIAVHAQVFTTVAVLNTPDGYNPVGMNLIQGRDGNFYGTAANGGATGCDLGCGTVFKLTPTGNLSAFEFCQQGSCADGSGPMAALFLGTDGDLYGTTQSGGVNCSHGLCGTVFKINPLGGLTSLHSFAGNDGTAPYAPVAEAGNDDFYGTTSGRGSTGAGTIFRIDATGALTTIHQFTGGQDGGNPYAGLLQASDGNFYGTTDAGGKYQTGTIFRVTLSGQLSTVHSFCASHPGGLCADGAGLEAGLIQASDGNLYGTTQYEGAFGGGTFYRLTPDGTLTTLYNFCSQTNCTDGSVPYGALVQGTDGNFYGTTNQGGTGHCSIDCGTVFQITPAGVLTTLHNFNGGDGATPMGGLLQATNGSFYGTTLDTVFKIDMGLGPFVTFVLPFGRVGEVGGILGQGFTGATAVSVNGTPANFKVVADTYLAATIPPDATTGYVTVTTPTGVLTSNVPFRVIQ